MQLATANQFDTNSEGWLSVGLIINTFGQPALNPQGPLVAITNGALTLVYGRRRGYTAHLRHLLEFARRVIVRLIMERQHAGRRRTTTQFSSVMSSLTGLYILSDFWTGSGASSGEILGLDNVNLPTAASVPEPNTISTLLGGLGVLAFWRRAKRS